MKITKQYLKRVIKEEIEKLHENMIPTNVVDWFFIYDNARQISLVGHVASPEGGTSRATIPVEKVEKTKTPNEYLITTEDEPPMQYYINFKDANKQNFPKTKQIFDSLQRLGILKENIS